jgi:hypothetical protein
MKSSIPSLAFGVLLLLGVGAKLLTNRPAPELSLAPFRQEGARLLRAKGYRVRVDPAGPLRGSKSGCRVLLGDYSPYGTFADLYREMARPIGPLHFAYRGERYAEAPKLRPLIELYVEREFRRLGWRVRRHPIAAVAATPGCGVDEDGWQGLASLPT